MITFSLIYSTLSYAWVKTRVLPVKFPAVSPVKSPFVACKSTVYLYAFVTRPNAVFVSENSGIKRRARLIWQCRDLAGIHCALVLNAQRRETLCGCWYTACALVWCIVQPSVTDLKFACWILDSFHTVWYELGLIIMSVQGGLDPQNRDWTDPRWKIVIFRSLKAVCKYIVTDE